jgi:hypothetical protein
VVRAIEPHDSVERYTGLGVEVLQGTPIVDPWTVEIALNDGGKQVLTTRSIVIAAGAPPFVPPLPGLDEVGYLTSDTLWDTLRAGLPAAPGGAGRRADRLRAGAELCAPGLAGHAGRDGAAHHDARGRGSVELARDALRPTACRCSPATRRCAANAWRRQGAGGGGTGQEKRIAFDALLCAVGRRRGSTGYRPGGAGHPVGRTVETNEYLQTIYPNILRRRRRGRALPVHPHRGAPGLVRGGQCLFGDFKKFKADYSVIPWATFIDPEVARVGLNEQDAKAEHRLRGHALRHRRPGPRHRRQRGARLREGADRAGQGPHPGRDHRRHARRRPAGRVRAGDEARAWG